MTATYHTPVLLHALLAAAGRPARAVDATLGEHGMQYLLASYGSESALAAMADFRPDLILLDLGVSSRQLDEDARGFSFRPGAPLDMRMGPAGPTAAALLNQADASRLERIF